MSYYYNNEKIKKFISENKVLMEQPIVKAFLDNNENYDLFVKTISDPTKTNEKELDDKFKNHYTKIRFIKYMSTLIHFSAIEYDKKHNSYNKRYPLTLDQPLNSENETTMIDILIKHDQDIFNDIQDKYTDSENLTEYFECPYLILEHIKND